MREKEEETGVVACSLSAFPNPVLPGTGELGAVFYQQASWDSVLLSQLLEIGPRQKIGNGRDIRLLSQDQVIEFIVRGLLNLRSFWQLDHQAKGRCQCHFSPVLLEIKLELFIDGRIRQPPTPNIRMSS